MEEDKKLLWLDRELKKHPEMANWLMKSLPALSRENLYPLTKLDPEELLRLKGRWASHKSRRKNKNLSCSISREAYKQLCELKGKYPLKETLEIMIALAHENQTPFNPKLDLRKTTPLVETYRNINLNALPLELENVGQTTRLGRDILQLQKTLTFQTELINDLYERINRIEATQKS